jgi:predicted alpha/beta hydrolase family esterase
MPRAANAFADRQQEPSVDERVVIPSSDDAGVAIELDGEAKA